MKAWRWNRYGRWPAVVALLMLIALLGHGPAPRDALAQANTPSPIIVGDGIPAPLTDTAGDRQRGRAIVTDARGNCVLCHALPVKDVPAFGNLGPSLAGAGARLNAKQLRLRIVDSRRLNPQSVMPSYFRTDGLTRVAERYRGQPILDAQEVEDVVAYLTSLRDPP